MDKQKIYFPNLNGLRFIAALLVIIHHTEEFKSVFKMDNISHVMFIYIIGKLGVILFFVLSGFLITYLLLAEEEKFKSIRIKDFYFRRILRVWPLYFLIVLLALSILPHTDFFIVPGFEKEVVYENIFLKIILYVCFLPNLIFPLYGIVPYAAHTWSIGTEEQFYLIWPLILIFIKRNRMVLMVVIVLCYLITKTALGSHYLDFLPFKNTIYNFWDSFNISCMAIGGFFSIILFQKNKYLKIFMNINLFYIIIFVTIIFIAIGVNIPYFHYEFYAFLFGIIILNFAANDKLKISLENKVLNYLGRISYGLYMFHPISIVFSLQLANILNLNTNWFSYPLILIVTILLAGLSYEYYESIFLKLKFRYSPIISSDKLKHEPLNSFK